MILQRIQHKLFKIAHPVIGEIWMVHRVLEPFCQERQLPDLEITADELERRITTYQQRGFSFVPIDQLPKRGRWVCLTFDDGYHDTYSNAFPLLNRLGIPFTVYVTTGFIDNQLPIGWYPHQPLGISADELREMDRNPLCTIGAHTVSHPELDKLTHQQQYQEIAQSKQTLETLLGHEIQHISFPHGAYNTDTLDICRALRFKTTARAWGGAVRKGIINYALPRIPIWQSTKLKSKN